MKWVENTGNMITIGGSEAAAVCGVSDYVSPLTIYLEKRGELPPRKVETEAVEWGIRLENEVAKKFIDETGFTIIPKQNAIAVSDEYPFMHGSFDRIIKDDNGFAILEIKTTSGYNTKAWADDNIPLSVLVQLHHYLIISSYRTGYVAVLIGGQHYRSQKIPRDEDLCRMIIEKEEDLIKRIKEGNPPPATELDGEILKNLYPIEDNEIKLPNRIDDLILEIKTLEENIKNNKKQVDKLKNQIKQAMENHAIGYTNRYSMKIKDVITKRFDYKTFRSKGYNDLYNQFLKETISRRLIIKELK